MNYVDSIFVGYQLTNTVNDRGTSGAFNNNSIILEIQLDRCQSEKENNNKKIYIRYYYTIILRSTPIPNRFHNWPITVKYKIV